MAPSFDRDTGPGDFASRIITYLVVLGSTLFVFIQLRPSLLFSNSMDVGGDNAAHVAASYYFLHHLFPHFQLSGWDPQWFGGFPLYVFYFPVPAVLTAILSGIMPFAVAFKVVTVLGSLLLPLAAYLFGRLCGFSRPVPAVMSVASLTFLFNTSYTIDGGNIPSTLAGEFSFSLALVFALLFLGMVVFSLRTGRYRWVSPILFALTLLCHVVPALFVAGAAAIVIVTWRDRWTAFRIIAPIGIVGALISGFWLLRFAVDLPYSSSMGYTRVAGIYGNLLPSSGEIVIPLLAIVGALYAIVRGQRVMLAMSLMAIASALAFIYLPSGLVFNGRWLPFWFFTTTFIAAYALAELGGTILGLLESRHLNTTLTPALASIAIVAIIAGYLGALPFVSTTSASRSFIPTWISWNYSGYQAKSGWANYESVVTMLDHMSSRYGCGRLDYEYSPNFNNPFGSTLAPMSLPMWTNGCIETAEGLYFESSTSTPFHFLDQAELSIDASNPVVGIPYQSLNVADGIRHLALTGVRYFLANSTEVEQQANADPQLTPIASTPADPSAVETASGYSNNHPRWVVYLIRSSPIVRGLRYVPVVESDASRTLWNRTAIQWYQTEADWPVVLASNGPPSWRRVAAGTLLAPQGASRITPAKVTQVTTRLSSLSFRVSTLNRPVLVNVPYFPNWRATGAQGPFLVSPNMMVVVPTSHLVTLTFGTTTTDWLGRFLTILGIGLLWFLRKDVPVGPQLLEAPLPFVAAFTRRLARSGAASPSDGEYAADEVDELSNTVDEDGA